VFDLDTIALLATAQRMRLERRLPSGVEIGGPVSLVLGAAELPIDPPAGWRPQGPDLEDGSGRRSSSKTQFCMDAEAVRRYAGRLLELGVAQKLPILIGVAPIPSARSGPLDEGEALRSHDSRIDRRAARARADPKARERGSASSCCSNSPASPASPGRMSWRRRFTRPSRR